MPRCASNRFHWSRSFHPFHPERLQSIAGRKPHNLAEAAAEATLTWLAGRMACQTKREVTWDELPKTA